MHGICTYDGVVLVILEHCSESQVAYEVEVPKRHQIDKCWGKFVEWVQVRTPKVRVSENVWGNVIEPAVTVTMSPACATSCFLW
jgi:hypothetical protein